MQTCVVVVLVVVKYFTLILTIHVYYLKFKITIIIIIIIKNLKLQQWYSTLLLIYYEFNQNTLNHIEAFRFYSIQGWF